MKPHPLKVEREQRGWSQRKVAKVLGINARTVSRWESRLAMPQLYYREQLSLLFGKTVEQLGLLEAEEVHQNNSAQEVVLPLDVPPVPEATVPQQTSSLDTGDQPLKQDKSWDRDHHFSYPFRWDVRGDYIRHASRFRAFGYLSRRYLPIVSIMMLACLVIIAVPLVFNRLFSLRGQALPASINMNVNYSPPYFQQLDMGNCDPHANHDTFKPDLIDPQNGGQIYKLTTVGPSPWCDVVVWDFSANEVGGQTCTFTFNPHDRCLVLHFETTDGSTIDPYTATGGPQPLPTGKHINKIYLDTTQLDPSQSYLIGPISYQNCQ
jgi:transcriptional regulator with XRE-family HTH domain